MDLQRELKIGGGVIVFFVIGLIIDTHQYNSDMHDATVRGGEYR